MKRLCTIIFVLCSTLILCGKTNTYRSNELGIAFMYDTDVFYEVTPQAKNTIFKLESSEYMVLVTINVQKNVQSIDFTDPSLLENMTNMKRSFPFVSKILQSAQTYKYKQHIGAKEVDVITGKNQYSMVDITYCFYHRNNLVTVTFETFEWNYEEYPQYSEQFITGLKLY